MSNSHLILIDGSSYLFRAYHAIPMLTNAKGEPTNAVYGVINMIRGLCRDHDSSHIAVVFDAKGKNFRHELFPDYKANREAMPEELAVQIPYVHEIIKAMGIPLIMESGVEADDVIGTLAKQAAEKGCTVLISTGDKDFAQLVTDKIKLINTMSNQWMTPETVPEKFGVKPEQIIDYLALMGDTSDNVPGVPSVGPKTAAKWLEQFGTLESIVEHADDIKGKVGESLRANLEQLTLSKTLVTIRCDVPLHESPEDLIHGPADKEKLRHLYAHLEFKSWLHELGQAEKEALLPPAAVQYQTILKQSDLDAWIERLKNAKTFAFDTETTSLNEMQAEIVGLSFSVKALEAAYVPLAHVYEGAPEQLNREKVLAQLKPLLEHKDLKKIGQNIKYDKKVLANYDIDLQGIEYDTMLESYVLNSAGSRHNMDTLALTYLGHETVKYEDLAGKGAKQICFSAVPIEKAGFYGAEDADITLRLHEKMYPELKQTPSLLKVFHEIEMPVLSVLARMERYGVLIDKDILARQGASVSAKIKTLEDQIYALAGEEFNISSPAQLGVILFDKLGLPARKKTPTGKPSTAENVLEDLAFDYELPKFILEYRSLTKLRSTYIEALPSQIDSKTGRVHTSYQQAVASTGRLSSSDPNLQNIPIRTEEGRKIRQAFVAPKGYVLLAADYSQIELRIMAHLSNDPGLISAFEKGLDVHKATAAEMHGWRVEDVTPEQRRAAKAINFGLIYGMSAYGLAKQLGIPAKDAQALVDMYFKKYPGVLEYMQNTRALAHKQGFVETLFGRRLYLPDINSSNKMMQQGSERAAINAPMQGTAADIIKRAMIALDAVLPESKLRATMVMQVHDELVFECHEGDVEALKVLVKAEMESAADLKVPLIVDVGVGANWDEAH